MGILVEHARIGIGRRRIEIVVELLDVLAVIALGIAEPEQAFLEDRIRAVPQRDAETERLRCVAKSAEAVLAQR